MVNILRADQLSAATGGLSVTTITVPAVSPLEPGAAPCVTTEVEASGLRTYSRNAITLAKQNSQELLFDLADDMAICFPGA